MNIRDRFRKKIVITIIEGLHLSTAVALGKGDTATLLPLIEKTADQILSIKLDDRYSFGIVDNEAGIEEHDSSPCNFSDDWKDCPLLHANFKKVVKDEEI